MFTLVFWKAAFERAFSTVAQTAVLLIGADMANWMTLDYLQIVAMSAIGGGLSILKAIAAAGLSDGSPSIGNVESLKAVDSVHSED